jgi:hypothetical protein
MVAPLWRSRSIVYTTFHSQLTWQYFTWQYFTWQYFTWQYFTWQYFTDLELGDWRGNHYYEQTFI